MTVLIEGMEMPVDLLSDYDDGYNRMTTVLKRMSAAGVVGYAETAGHQLDALVGQRSFYDGMHKALMDEVDLAMERIPGLGCEWRDLWRV